MCGRFVLAADASTLQQEFNLKQMPDIQARYNIAPSQPVPVITSHQPETLTHVTWGLVPSWVDDPNNSTYKMINARSETAADKPAYRGPFRNRRCLIPANGFYEWTQGNGKHKQPHYIYLNDTNVFAFAGLWDVWQGSDGSEIWSCTIMTTEAADSIEHLHHRMPVILEADARDIWLDNSSQRDDLQALLQPFDADRLAHHPVSTAVNSTRNDSPDLIERDAPPQQQTLF
jgi:putative SOS response-associated peptidase YedK